MANDKATGPSNVDPGRKLAGSVADRLIGLAEIMVFPVAGCVHLRMWGPLPVTFCKTVQCCNTVGTADMSVSIDHDPFLAANGRDRIGILKPPVLDFTEVVRGL